jgi:hypothetical protein
MFADRRSFLGIPNFNDVVSNLPFATKGLWEAGGRGGLTLKVPREVWCFWSIPIAKISLIDGNAGHPWSFSRGFF